MAQGKDPEFEERLKEILEPSPADASEAPGGRPRRDASREQEPLDTAPPRKPLSPRVEFLVRIVAALLALGLLLLFGLQIASR